MKVDCSWTLGYNWHWTLRTRYLCFHKYLFLCFWITLPIFVIILLSLSSTLSNWSPLINKHSVKMVWLFCKYNTLSWSRILFIISSVIHNWSCLFIKCCLIVMNRVYHKVWCFIIKCLSYSLNVILSIRLICNLSSLSNKHLLSLKTQRLPKYYFWWSVLLHEV